MVSKWRLIERIEENGGMQMAIDEAILISKSQGTVPDTLRFYTWKPPAVSIGFFQGIHEEIDMEKAKKNGVDVVRRITGGGAVLHENELTYSLVVSEGVVSNDISESYREICGGLVEGLKLLGVKAEFRPINDIVVNERKISGSAQTRRNGVVLQHGTLLLDVNPERMFSILKVPEEKMRDKIVKDVRKRVTSLREERGDVSLEKVESSLRKGFEKVFGVRLVKEELTEEEVTLAGKLFKEKYSTERWNLWR